jgi:molecular chaperone HtpG
MSVETKPETMKFQAEVQQVLDLMIHSLYSNREIFLRELISNASDACDRLRFAALSEEGLYGDDSELRVDVQFDSDQRTITVRDNGIGMTRDEVVENIGTIARSGTNRFLESLSGDQKQDAQLIGQFGVGFYSAFIVADQVTLETRSASGGAGVRWQSDGRGEYTIEETDDLERGTAITLHLKEDGGEFLADYALRGLIRKYSDHIAFPVRMQTTVTEEPAEGEEAEPVERTEWQAVNQASALWTRPKSEIEDEEYRGFYKHVAHDFAEPMTWAHNHVEGNQSFTTLLYLPSQVPFDLMMGGRDERHGLKLYVRRVFIMDAAEQLLPNYLRFARGVVDSNDLPLNVSREILQENKLVAGIRASVVKRVLDMIGKLDDEQFSTFWKHFGEVLKEGLAEDAGSRDKLLKLVRYASTHENTDEPKVSLADYVGRMKGGQDKIYYLTAEGLAAAKNSAHLEVFRKQGIEVLLMTDRVDEWVMGQLSDFEGKPFQSVAKGEIDLTNMEDESDRKAREESEEKATDLIKRLSDSLGDRVEAVKVSHRLTESPSCLVLGEHEMAVHMQSLLKQAGHELPGGKPTLEINPDHEMILRLESESDDERFGDWAALLFEQAWLAAGGVLEDPAGFVRRMNRLIL